jgi:hypothetical protein
LFSLVYSGIFSTRTFSKILCTLDPWWHQRITWVWKYNKESRLQIDASSDCANICGRATFHARHNSPFTRPWSAQSCSTAVREEGFPNDMRPKNWKWCLQEEVQPRTRQRVWQPECPKCHEDKQIALRWSQDQKTQRPTTKSSIQSQTQWKEKSKKIEIQVGG